MRCLVSKAREGDINLWHVSLHRHTHSIKTFSYKIEKVEEHNPNVFVFIEVQNTNFRETMPLLIS